MLHYIGHLDGGFCVPLVSDFDACCALLLRTVIIDSKECREHGIVRVAAYVEIRRLATQAGRKLIFLGDLVTGRLNNRNFGAGTMGKEAVGYGGNYDYYHTSRPGAPRR